MELKSHMAKGGQLLECAGVVVAETSPKVLAHFCYIVMLLKVQGLDDRNQWLVKLRNELCLQRCVVDILHIRGVSHSLQVQLYRIDMLESERVE